VPHATAASAMVRRVVVTGVGLVTPLGLTAEATWSALTGGAPAASAAAAASTVDLAAGRFVVMRVPPLDASQPPPPMLGRDVPPFVHYALVSAAAALQDAGFAPRLDDAAAARAGTSIGVGMAHVADLLHAAQRLAAGKPRRISPFLVPRVLLNTPAGLVAQTHNLQGPNTAPATACAAGAHAVIEGFHAIRRGDADVMVVGGAEAAVEEVGLTGFARARALSTAFAGTPQAASRPFDARRDGFVMGEGAGTLVLEELESARRRGVSSVYAELVGTGMTGDAWHVTSPPPDGRGARRAMQAALRSAGVDASSVDYVNAHATSTPVGDAIERRAIADVIGRGDAVASSTKGATGHMLGAAGAVEAAFAALSIASHRVPPTANLDALDVDEKCDALGWGDLERYVPHTPLARLVNVAMTNAFGFGGTNACILMSQPPDGLRRRQVR
jgi:3-oxoacyl-[acyl-carrier-protein] synthase II